MAEAVAAEISLRQETEKNEKHAANLKRLREELAEKKKAAGMATQPPGAQGGSSSSSEEEEENGDDKDAKVRK